MPEIDGMYYYHHQVENKLQPAVIVLHGLGGDHLSWPVEIRRLPGCEVITPDLPGHGNSRGSGRQSVNGYADGIVEFMDSVGVWRAVLVGHSMGGAIALAIACRHPERTSGLVLISCGARLPVPRQIMDNAINSTTFPAAVRSLQELMNGPGTLPRLAEQTGKRLMALRPSLVLGDLLACDQYDGTDCLSSIKSPTLVISGMEDRLTPPQYSTSLAAHIPGAALQRVDVAGHLLPLEQPKRLAKLLSVFIHSIPDPRGF